MTILATNTAGAFSGSYHTAVSATNKQILVSPLQGVQQHPSAKRNPTFGFTVQWQFSGTAVTVIPCPCWEWNPLVWCPKSPVAPRGTLAVDTDVWTQMGHTHIFLSWEVVMGELSVSGGFQDCLEGGVHPSVQETWQG